jgi:hypothetical protein
MASTIGKVRAVFTASTSGLTAGVNAASASMKRLQSDVAGLRSGMGALVAIQGTQLFASFVSGATAAARSLVGMGAAATEAISQQNDLASRLGTTYGELAGLSYAGSLVGVSMDQIGAAMTRAQVTFAKAADGSKQANAAFARLGLSVADLNGLSTEQQFEAIAQAISELPSEAERAAAAVAVFGKAGVGLLPMFNEGAAGIRAAREEAERFGLTLTNAQAGNVDAMGDSFDKVRAAIQGVINQVTAYLAPAVTAISTAFTDMVGSIGGANIGQAIGDGILQGARYFAEVADAFVAQMGPLWNYVSEVGAQWSAVWDVASRVGSALAGVGRLISGAFLTLVGVFSGIGQAILTAIRGAAEALGFDTTGLDVALAGLQGFNDQLGRDIEGNFNAAGQNFSAVFEQSASTAGEAIAGPFTQTIDQAIAAARDAADDIDVAARQEVEVTQKVDAAGVAQAVREGVKGIESNSTEGIKEMFRIMRGDQADQREAQNARNLARIADNTEDMGELDLETVELAAGAGG